MPWAASPHAQAAPQTPAAGERHRGWVRSFRGTWGFLNSEAFNGDVFVGLKGNPHISSLSQDDQVEFDVKFDDKGKAEAVNVVVVGQSPNANAAGTGAGAAAQQQPGMRYKGWVRSFTGSWGFVNSDAFPGDLFVGLRSNPHLTTLTAGEQVEFDIKASGAGKNEAVNVQPESLSGMAAPGMAAGAGPTSTTPTTPSAAPAAKSSGPAERAQVPHLVGTQITGRIKSFRDHWGFVNSDLFAGDLFIHSRSNPELGPVGPGDSVQFEVAEDPTKSSGEYHAVGAVVMKEDLQTLVGQTVRGWVKSFKDSWGLLNSNRFDGDVFVGVRANPQIGLNGLQQGKCVEFQIARDEKSANGIQAMKVKQLDAMQSPMVPVQPSPVTLPKAENAAQGAPKPGPESFVGHRARGVVRSFRDGWGFVISEDFDGDLFLHQGSNPGLGTLHAGDPVTFDISLGSSGKCHATKVQAVTTELKDLVGRQCSGRVRSFQDSWGFITSQKFPGDLFVGMRSNPHLPMPLKQGDNVEFLVQRSAGNKSQTGFEAINVKVEGGNLSMVPAAMRGAPILAAAVANVRATSDARSRSPRPVALGTFGAPAAAAGERSPGSMVGSTLYGWMRSFRGTWGFAQSESFDGDLFVGTRSNSHLPRELAVGDTIQFTVAQNASGKLEAVDVAFT